MARRLAALLGGLLAAAVAGWAGHALWFADRSGFHPPYTTSGRVLALDDGDSFELATPDRGRLHVRLHAVDTPELVQSGGREARAALGRLLDGAAPRVSCYKTDPRGRAVCRVRVAEQDVGLALVQQGWAWHYRVFEDEQTAAERQALQAAQSEAMRARRGLWAAADPLAPWECRARLRQGQRCP